MKTHATASARRHAIAPINRRSSATVRGYPAAFHPTARAHSRGSLRWLLTGGLLAGAMSLACVPLKVDTRTLFAKASYSTSAPAPPASGDQLTQQVFAKLEPEAVMAYRDPVKMGSCLRAIATKEPADIERFGETLAKAGAAWGHFAAVEPLPKECAIKGEPPALIRFVVARIATAATSLAYMISGDQEQRKENVYKQVPKALNQIATILEHTKERSMDAQDAPALALRGGAANGAFSAGFMFELLSLRERALIRDWASAPESASGKYRFSAMVGTSVGALIAQIVDLYFVESVRVLKPIQQRQVDDFTNYWDPAKRQAKQYAAVDLARSTGAKGPDGKSCYDGWPNYPKGVDDDTEDEMRLSGLDAKTRDYLFKWRPLQMVALTTMYKAFTDNDEQTLMCVEPGPVTRLVGILGSTTQNLMRFDPMDTNVIAPMLDAFSRELIDNDVTRVVVAVEMQNNRAVGLDERICSTLDSSPTDGKKQESAKGREYCLGSAVMASSTIPIFARPVNYLYDGGNTNYCGTWFDGGLRSVFPAYRALRMTRPTLPGFVNKSDSPLRVLALATGPLEVPQPPPSNVIDVLLGTEGQAVGQNEIDQITLAQQMVTVRNDQICDIIEAMPHDESTAQPDPCQRQDRAKKAEAKGIELEAINTDLSVSPVYLPVEAPPYIAAGAEYSFDRTLMRGLWVWGRHEAITRVLGKGVLPGTLGLFSRLGWSDLEAKAQTFAEADGKTMQPWLDEFKKPECGPHQSQRVASGRDRITNQVPDCDPLAPKSSTVPQYFYCPSDKQ